MRRGAGHCAARAPAVVSDASSSSCAAGPTAARAPTGRPAGGVRPARIGQRSAPWPPRTPPANGRDLCCDLRPPSLRKSTQLAMINGGRTRLRIGPTSKITIYSWSTRPFRSDHLIVGLCVPLTDAQWARIEPLLPDRTPKRGGRWRDHREVIDAIAFKFKTGTQWVHLPEKYGNWRGVYNRLRFWAVDGTWERVFTALMAQADADKDLNWAVSVDSTVVRAHQHAAGARKKGGPSRRAGRPRPRPVPRRTDHKDPPRRRRPLPAAGLRSYGWPGWRRTRLYGGDGPPARSPTSWTAAHQARRGPGR